MCLRLASVLQGWTCAEVTIAKQMWTVGDWLLTIWLRVSCFLQQGGSMELVLSSVCAGGDGVGVNEVWQGGGSCEFQFYNRVKHVAKTHSNSRSKTAARELMSPAQAAWLAPGEVDI